MSKSNVIKITEADGTVFEGTAEEIAKFHRITQNDCGKVCGEDEYGEDVDNKRLDVGGRTPQEGDKIIITNPQFTGGQYEKGDINTVRGVAEEGAVYVKEHYIGLFRDEFAILPESYRDERNEAEECGHEIEVGDIVRVTEYRFGHEVGTIGEVTEVEIGNFGWVKVATDVERTSESLHEHNVELVAKASDRVDRRE